MSVIPYISLNGLYVFHEPSSRVTTIPHLGYSPGSQNVITWIIGFDTSGAKSRSSSGVTVIPLVSKLTYETLSVTSTITKILLPALALFRLGLINNKVSFWDPKFVSGKKYPSPNAKDSPKHEYVLSTNWKQTSLYPMGTMRTTCFVGYHRWKF